MNRIDQPDQDPRDRISRRNMLKTTVGASAAAVGLASCASVERLGRPVAPKGHVNHSVAQWCFAPYWELDKMCEVATMLGCTSVELVAPNDFPTLKKHGLVCAMAPNGTPDPPFVKGFNNPEYHDMIITCTGQTIDACAAYGFPNVIAFTGYRENIPDDVGMANCVTGLKKIIGYAEKKKVNLCLEVLNSRVAEDMKGHPGYQGDHTDYCMEIVRKVGSPRMKLLFDIYHIEIMDGDIIRRIWECKDYIGHYHVAGNPGRNEIDDTQEINYRPIMQEIARTGYTGYVGYEFIPTRDPYTSLRQAVRLCDV